MSRRTAHGGLRAVHCGPPILRERRLCWRRIGAFSRSPRCCNSSSRWASQLLSLRAETHARRACAPSQGRGAPCRGSGSPPRVRTGYTTALGVRQGDWVIRRTRETLDTNLENLATLDTKIHRAGIDPAKRSTRGLRASRRNAERILFPARRDSLLHEAQLALHALHCS